MRIECINSILEDTKEREDRKEREFIEKYKTSINKLTSIYEEIIKQTGCTIADIRQITTESLINIEGANTALLN